MGGGTPYPSLHYEMGEGTPYPSLYYYSWPVGLRKLCVLSEDVKQRGYLSLVSLEKEVLKLNGN